MTHDEECPEYGAREQPPFELEDYVFTARLLREHLRDNEPKLFQAVCSNNLNIILSALDHAAAAPDLLEALGECLELATSLLDAVGDDEQEGGTQTLNLARTAIAKAEAKL